MPRDFDFHATSAIIHLSLYLPHLYPPVFSTVEQRIQISFFLHPFVSLGNLPTTCEHKEPPAYLTQPDRHGRDGEPSITAIVNLLDLTIPTDHLIHL